MRLGYFMPSSDATPMVRVPGDTDDPDDIVDDPPVWPFSIVILHGAIVGALLAWVVGWV